MEPISTLDPWKYLKMKPNPDGTITRLSLRPTTPASDNPSATTNPSISKDIPINHQKGTYIRLYLPKFAINNSQYRKKLPILVYYHGGGFVVLHANSKLFHDFCGRLAATAKVMVASVEYRLAPEHRLPAAYNDAIDALTLISYVHDDWLLRHGDLSNCFVMGSSSGGNIAYHTGLQATKLNLYPLRVRGLILHAPFFGGVDRTRSERRLANSSLPVFATDLMWELALPKGANRDHEYSNPIKGGGSGELKRVDELGWKVLLTGCSGDPLIDRMVKLGKLMEEKKVDVVTYFTEGGYHGNELMEPTLTRPFMELIKVFVISSVRQDQYFRSFNHRALFSSFKIIEVLKRIFYIFVFIMITNVLFMFSLK